MHTSMTPNQSRQGPQRTCVRYPTSVHEGSWVQRRQVTFKLVSLGKADMIYTSKVRDDELDKIIYGDEVLKVRRLLRN